MSDKNICKLCQAGLALKIDHEKSSNKSVNSLLQRLFDCYKIDVSVLEGSPSACKQCFEGVLQISEQLEKWSNAQKVLQETRLLDIDDAMVSVKKEPWDENDDAEFIAEDSLEIFKNETLNSDDLEFLDEEEPTEDLEFLDENEPQAEYVKFLDVEETQKEDVQPLSVEPSKNQTVEVSAKVYEELFGIEQYQETSTDPLDWRLTSHEFFCVFLGPDGLALAVLFREKTPQRSIRMLCTCCHRVFSTMSEIQKHSMVRRVHPEYWCRSCGIYFPTITELKFHENYKNHHLVTSKFVLRCLKCDRISTLFTNAITHEKTVHNKISYNCMKCRVSFNSRESLAKHQWKHRNKSCLYPICRRKFRLWEEYVSHLNWHRRRVSRCPIKHCPILLMPGAHVKHLITHSKK